MTEIRFKDIRKHGTSQEDGFEELCCQLLHLKPPSEHAQWIRKRGAGGDGGVEAYWIMPNGQEHCLQSKYFFQFEEAQRKQMNTSVTAMLKSHPTCSVYYMCIPFNFGEQRAGNKWSQKMHWDKCVSKWTKEAMPREVTFILWDESQLVEFLSDDKPEYNGRRYYWFDDRVLTKAWFKQNSEDAVSNLGQRYTPEMHVDLPLSNIFAAARRGDAYWEMVNNPPDIPVINKSLSLSGAQRFIVEDIKQKIAKVVSDIYRAGSSRVIDDSMSTAEALVDSLLLESAELASELNHDLYWEFHNNLEEFKNYFENCLIFKATDSAVLLSGAGGVGKSHILADAVQSSISEGHPAILMLGQQLKSVDPYVFIRNSLDYHDGFDTLLGALDSCAQAHGCRALIAIDALNEGDGKSIWPDHLPGLVKRISRYPNLVLIFSCKTSYCKRLTVNLQPDIFVEIEHNGFVGHEETAAEVYLDKNGISRPDAPILDPEFSNPLFLKTICESVKRKGQSKFPKGLKGVSSIFEYYIDAICTSIETKQDLDPSRKLVKKCINKLIAKISENNDYISYESAVEISDAFVDSNGSEDKSLIFHLKSEGVLTEDLIYKDQPDNSGEEIIRMSYERFLDHLKAKRFIDTEIKRACDLENVFDTGGKLHELTSNEPWRQTGFIEALSIQIPELFQRELIEFIPNYLSDTDYFGLAHVARNAFVESLYWRADSQSNQITLNIFEDISERQPIKYEILIKCALANNHVLNYKYLHKVLAELEMPERDKDWGLWVAKQWIASEEFSRSSTTQFVEWAWSVNSDPFPDEQIKSISIVLIWMLCTPLRELRDKATKALAHILSI